MLDGSSWVWEPTGIEKLVTSAMEPLRPEDGIMAKFRKANYTCGASILKGRPQLRQVLEEAAPPSITEVEVSSSVRPFVHPSVRSVPPSVRPFVRSFVRIIDCAADILLSVLSS